MSSYQDSSIKDEPLISISSLDIEKKYDFDLAEDQIQMMIKKPIII